MMLKPYAKYSCLLPFYLVSVVFADLGLRGSSAGSASGRVDSDLAGRLSAFGGLKEPSGEIRTDFEVEGSALEVADPYDEEDYEHQYNQPAPISLEGCVAWFKAEEANVPWPSVVGSHEGKVVGKKADAVLELGHGARRNVRFLRGDEKTRFDFGEVLDEIYTICSVTRYAGEPYGRILQGSEENWLHGQSKKNTGVLCAGQETPGNLSREDWVVVCAASDDSDALVNGEKVSQKGCQNAKVKQNLVINHGKKWQEVSSWAVMEVIVWNKVLDAEQMAKASDYLMAKLATGVQEDYKITKPDGNCNGHRVQVQLQVSASGWRHNADGGDLNDKTVYPTSEETFGTVKIMEDSLPMVSERNPDELSPWAHSSLRGKAFVLMGNHQGPTTLSFFAIDRNLTLRVYVNGSEWKDLELKHGRAGYLRGKFHFSRVLVMGTSNFLMFMSGHEQKFSSPVAPAAKSIYGPCAGDWHVTSLKGNVTSIKQECSDGTSHIYESRTVSWKTHDAVRSKTVSSLLVAGEPGWYKVSDEYKTCNATCAAAALTCSTDSSLLSSPGKIKVAMSQLGETCVTVEDPQNGTRAGSFRTGEKGTICTPSGEMSLNCSAQATDATRICFCKGTEELYKLAPRGSNVCPDQYRAIESVEDCQEAAGAGMQGLPPPSSWEKNDPNNQGSPSSCFKDLETGKVRFNSISMRGFEKLDEWQKLDHRKICKKAFSGPEKEPMCKFTALEDQVFLGGVSYDKMEDGGTSVVTFMPPGVFQMETKMPFGITQIKLISDKNATCKIKGKNYKLYGSQGVFSLRLKDRNLQALDLISCNQNVMVIGFKNMSTADASEASSDQEPRLNLLGATACHAANMRGVGGLVLDNVLHLEPGFVFVKTLEKNNLGEVSTITKEEFNTLVQPYNKYPVLKRMCPSCAASHTEILYRRYTALGGFSPYESMACSWSVDENNVEGKDFKLFSTLNDAFGDVRKWSVCSFNSTRGFPGECGPDNLVEEQWNSIPVDAGSSSGKCMTDQGGRAVSFYNFLPIVPQKFRLGLSVDSDGKITSLSEADFNRRFQESRYHIILRKCQSCRKSHRYIFYRRFSNTETYEPYKLLACDWESSADNLYLVDFKLYSDLQDALADNNPWDFCGFDGSGFPGTCSSDGKAREGQSSYIPVTGCDENKTGKAVTFELLEDEEMEVEELEAEADEETPEIRDAVLPSGTVAAEGLVAWFRSEDAAPTWPSSVGTFKAEATKGTVRSAFRHYGAELKHVYGDSKSGFSFGDILPNTFTMCSLSAYTGIAQGKVLRGEEWWHGHADGRAGSVFYGGKWVRNEESLNGTRSWIALCASNQQDYVFIDGEERSGNFVGVGGHTNVGINDGPKKETSDWAVAEVITWDRVLTRGEMVEAQNYLRAKAKVCQPEQAAQCDSAPCVSLFVGPNQHNVLFRNADGTATVKTYLGAEISCICRGHCVGLVGAWQCDGGPYGGSYRITEAYSDDWTPATTRDSILLCTVARPVWRKKGELSKMALDVGMAKSMLKETSFTFTATVRRDSGGGPLTLFSSGHDASVAAVDLRMVSNADLTFGFSFSSQNCQTAVTEGSQEGEWQHLAFVYDLDKNETRIYLNALEVQLCPFRFAYEPNASASLMVGAYKGNARWIGAMKDAAIYTETLSTALIGRLAGELALPKAMVWFSFFDGWNRQSYVEAVSFCAKRHMKLAHLEDYCIEKDGNFSINPRAAPGDQWAPFAGSQENSWVQIGNGHSTMKPISACKTYLEAFGQKPTWGMDGKAYRYKSYLACKAPFGFIMHSSDRGVGKCFGEALATQDQAKTQSSCRMACIKSEQCKFASWTESNDDVSCFLFSSCTRWIPDEASVSWIKKPLG